jgi:drug/metabolite transporter (DMT)-like permease
LYIGSAEFDGLRIYSVCPIWKSGLNDRAIVSIQTMQVRHWAVLLGAAAMFGSAFSLTRVAVAQLPPVTVAAGRAALAAVVLFAMLRLVGDRLPATARAWRPLVVLGIVSSAVPFVALAWGQVHVQSSVAGILFGTTPLFTLLVAHFQTRDERLTRRRLAGAIAGLAGVAVVIGPSAILGLGSDLGGQALILFAALCMGSGAVYARRQMQCSPLAMSAAISICAAVILVPLSLALDKAWQLDYEFTAVAAVVGLGVLGTALPTPGVYWLIRSVGAATSSLLAYFIPVMAVLGGVFALGEKLSAPALGGFALILAGAMLVSRRV